MSELMLEMKNVCKRFNHFELKNINLTLSKGEMLGVIGANGAGKSTCLRLMMGFIEAQAGSIHVMGKPMPDAMEDVKRLAAYVSEDMRLYNRLSLEWHMHWLSEFYPSWDHKYSQHLLRVFQLDSRQLIKHLSTGQRIKAVLLLALARRPQLLILDEPTTGLDPVARHELMHELFSVMLNEDHSVVFSSQYTQDVERLSDQIAFIDDGEIISCQNKEEYLERWKRIRTPDTSIFTDQSSFPEIRCLAKDEGSVVINNFSADIQRKIDTLSNDTVLENLSLEEIFITQVVSRRSQGGRCHA